MAKKKKDASRLPATQPYRGVAVRDAESPIEVSHALTRQFTLGASAG